MEDHEQTAGAQDQARLQVSPCVDRVVDWRAPAGREEARQTQKDYGQEAGVGLQLVSAASCGWPHWAQCRPLPVAFGRSAADGHGLEVCLLEDCAWLMVFLTGLPCGCCC